MAVSDSFKIRALVSVIVLQILILLFWVFVLDCLPCSWDPKPPWRIDTEYAALLLSGPNENVDGVDAVDGIQIYDWRGLGPRSWQEEVEDGDLVYETKDEREVRSIVSSMRQHETTDVCDRSDGRKEFSLIVFDNTFMRAAYFQLTGCRDENDRHVVLRALEAGGDPIGASGIGSPRLAETLTELRVYGVFERAVQ